MTKVDDDTVRVALIKLTPTSAPTNVTSFYSHSLFVVDHPPFKITNPTSSEP